MARYAHRKIQSLLNEKREQISDGQFFTSRAMSSTLEDIAAAQTRRYTNKRIKVDVGWRDEPWAAFTNNQVISINAKFDVGKPLTRTQRYEMVLGLFAHELGHILFTNFDAPSMHATELLAGNWYPREPDALSSWSGRNHAAQFHEWANDDSDCAIYTARRAMLQQIVLRLHNILEDGHIEELILRKYPGKLGRCLEITRNLTAEDAPLVSSMLDEIAEGKRLAFTMYEQMLLDYAKFGIVRYGDATAKTPCVKKLYGLLDAVDEAVNEYASDARCAAVNEIILTLWPEMQEYLDHLVEKYLAQNVAPETIAEEDQRQSGPVGTTANPSCSGQLVSASEVSNGSVSTRSVTSNQTKQQVAAQADDDATAELNTAAELSEESEAAADSAKESGISENSDEAAKTEFGSEKSSSEAEESDGCTELAQSDSDADAADADEDRRQPVTPEETGRIGQHLGAAEAADGDGETVYNPDYEPQPYESAADDIDRILTGIAEDLLEWERSDELQAEVDDMDLGSIHNGCKVVINRAGTVTPGMIDSYNRVAPALLSISKQLQRNIRKQIEDHRVGTKLSGLVYGRRIEGRNLSRTDGKVFYKRNLPDDEPLMSVALLLDESGSMSSQDRASYARAAAIILQDFCDGLNIPFMCYGHSTGCDRPTVELYSYCEFEQIDRRDKYRLMDISARECNRDGAALRYVEKKLMQRPERTKLLILVSDGQPADNGYSGEMAMADLRRIKTDLRREGVIFVAAAIGSDRSTIEDIYGDSYLDISDLQKLPVTLTQLVKRHIKL